MESLRVRPKRSYQRVVHSLQQKQSFFCWRSEEGRTLQQLLQARRMRDYIDHSLPPIEQKKAGLLKREELLVGIVEAQVRADLGRYACEAVWTYLFSYGIFTLALKVAGLSTKGSFFYCSMPFFYRYFFKASVSLLCWAARIIKKLSS